MADFAKEMLWMGAEIVQIFVHSLLFKEDRTSLPLKTWPPEKFWHTALALPSHYTGKQIYGFQCLLLLKNIPVQ